MFQASGEARWLTVARRLLSTAVDQFGDDDGGFHDTAADAEPLLLRPRTTADNAEPSGQSALAGALLTCSALTGDASQRERAEAALAASGQLASRDPRFGGWALAVAEAAAAGPLQVAVVAAQPGDPLAGDLLAVARRSSSPGLVVDHGSVGEPDHPLLAERPLVAGRAAAYVCRGFVCDAPVTEVEALTRALAR
ncbi:hypothetical protein [Nostocoides sp. HKS02]|uniref:hypothetical protein n=1 Tax=Nostocoides sp. HKS02 TaxID=1813880 RepID=UPI00351BC17B